MLEKNLHLHGFWWTPVSPANAKPAIIPFQFDNTNTRTPSDDIDDIISFQLEDVTSPIDGGIVADVTVNLDYKELTSFL